MATEAGADIVLSTCVGKGCSVSMRCTLGVTEALSQALLKSP